MVSLRFDYRDIFRSARLAFSFQRLWIQFTGLFFGYVAYVVLTYLSLMLAGHELGKLFSRMGLLPGVIGYGLPWYSWIIYGLGAFALLFAWLVSGTGVARATYMNLKGNTFYSWKEAIRFAFRKKGVSVISTPVAILFIAVCTVAGGIVVGLPARIQHNFGDVVGVLISLFTVVWFLASLFLVFVILALGLSLFLTPSVLATTDDDAFEGIFQSFSTLYSQPWRFIIYELLLGVVAVIGLAILAFFAKQAWGLMNTILAIGMGEQYINLSYSASGMVENWVYPAVAWSQKVSGGYSQYIFFSQEFLPISLPLIGKISATIFAVSLTIIGGFILCYPLAIFNAGNSIIFLILKKKKDDENLLERKDQEEEDEEEMQDIQQPPVKERKAKPATKPKKKAPAKKVAPKKTAAKKAKK